MPSLAPATVSLVIVVRIALGVVGFAFILLGFADAFLSVLRKPAADEKPMRGNPTDPAAWAKLVKVSPRWLLFVLVGGALIVLAVLLK